MLSSSLVSTVERDLALARQLAYFHIGYSPNAQDMQVEPEQFVNSALPNAPTATADPTANAAAHIQVAVSDPVRRPRQGTCAVLIELTRPLTWLSNRGRHRGSGIAAASPAASSRGVANVGAHGGPLGNGETSSSVGTNVPLHYTAASCANHLNSSNKNNNGNNNGNFNVAAAAGVPTTISSSAASAFAAGGLSSVANLSMVGSDNDGNGVSTTGRTGAPSTPSSSQSRSAANKQRPDNASVLPLLVATATLEVVFPVRYPLEPCQWHFSEEVSFGGVGDHSTSSWAVTAGHRSGNSHVAARASSSIHPANKASNRKAGVWSTSSASSAVGEGDGAPRRPISDRLLAATAGEGTTMVKEHVNSDVPLSAAAAETTKKLTAFVVPALGRLLLRWMADARQSACNSSNNGGGGAAAASPPSPPHSRICLSDASPFLLDFACLLRCWSAVELGVHHLQLPSRIALAYGSGGGGGTGGGARLLRAMAGAHLGGGSGGGGGGSVIGTVNTTFAAALSFSNTNQTGSNNGEGGSVGHYVNTANSTQGNTNALGLAVPASLTGGANGSSGNNGTTANCSAGVGSAGSPIDTSSTVALPVSLVGTLSGSGTSIALAGHASGVGCAGVSPVASSAGTGASALYPYRRRTVKNFLAVMLPQGDVAVCGRALAAGAAGKAGGATTAPTRRGGGGGGTTVSVSAAAGTAETPVVSQSTVAKTGGAAAVSLNRVPFCLLPLYEQRKNDRDGEGQNRQEHQQQQQRRTAAVPGTSVACTSQFVRGKVLPSFLLPAHVLGSPYKCEWDDVRVFGGRGADAALHDNAKLAKALRLADVSDLLQVLRRLMKCVGTTTTRNLYLSEVLWPALMETVRVLRSTRLPFWAGLAVCSVLLPSVLEQEEQHWQRQQQPQDSAGYRGTAAPVGFLPAIPTFTAVNYPEVNTATALRRWCQNFADLIQVVTYAERVLAVACEYTLFCETRLVRCALQRGQQQLILRQRGCLEQRDRVLFLASVTGVITYPSAAVATSAALTNSCVLPAPPEEICTRLHAPISVCVVCGLSLLRNTVKNGGAAVLSEWKMKELARTCPTASSETGDEVEAHCTKSTHVVAAAAAAGTAERQAAVQASLQVRCAEGCLVVQCARCGHGGHVEHMSSWWNDPTVRCCPKGCDCICEY